MANIYASNTTDYGKDWCPLCSRAPIFYVYHIGNSCPKSDNSESLSIKLNLSQPSPVQNDEPIVWDMVMQDMLEREKMGVQKYRTHLQPFNGRDALIDAYQEALDLVVYLRQLIYEKEKNG